MKKLVLLVALLIASGCGGSTTKSDSPAAFLKQVTLEFSRGQAGPLWDQLIPSEQALVPRATYVACARNGFRLRSFKVLSQYDEPIDVEGKKTPATAVSVQVGSDDGITTATLHAVKVNGSWHWVLSRSDLAALRAGRCP